MKFLKNLLIIFTVFVSGSIFSEEIFKTSVLLPSSDSREMKISIPMYSKKFDIEDKDAKFIEISLEDFAKLQENGYVWSSLTQKWTEISTSALSDKGRLEKAVKAVLAEEEDLLSIFKESENEIMLRSYSPTKSLSKDAILE